MHDLSIEEINDIEIFRTLWKPWDELLLRCQDNNVFLTWEWLFTWWRYFGGDKKLRILLVKDAGKIIAIAPFMQSNVRRGIIGVNLLENICSAAWCDYSGIILTEKKRESIKILSDYLKKIIRDDRLILKISNVPENSEALSLLRSEYTSLSGSLLLEESPGTVCPYIELPATWSDYQQNLNRKTRETLRRKMRSLEKDHEVEFEKYSDRDSLPDKMEGFFRLFQKRWQASRLGNRFTEPEARHFYLDVSEAFYRNKWLDLSFLNVNGKPVSVCWGLVYNNIFHYMTLAFDPDYSNHSVGTLHMMKLIEQAIQNGARRFDFLQGIETYKFRWAHCRVAEFQITMTKKGVTGRYRLRLLQILTALNKIETRGLRETIQLYVTKRRQKREFRLLETDSAVRK